MSSAIQNTIEAIPATVVVDTVFRRLEGRLMSTAERVSFLCTPVKSEMPSEYNDYLDPFRVAINAANVDPKCSLPQVTLEVTDCNHVPLKILGVNRDGYRWTAIMNRAVTLRCEGNPTIRAVVTYDVIGLAWSDS